MVTMPHLVQMDKRYNRRGLQIIGAEVQRSAQTDIDKITKEYKVKFPITKGVSGPTTGSSLPRALVFDKTGKLVFMGNPGNEEFGKSVKTALRDIPGKNSRTSSLPERPKPLVEKRSWTNEDGKKIEAEVTKVEDDQIHFKLSNGRTSKYPIANLSASDQELIRNAEKERETSAE